MSILSLSFSEFTSVFDRTIYMQIESEKIPGKYKVIHVDEFESSIIVEQEQLLKLQKYLKRPCSEEQFNEAKEKLINKYACLLEENPVLWNTTELELQFNGIDEVDFLNAVGGLSYENYKNIATKIRPIVREAQIVMRRG